MKVGAKYKQQTKVNARATARARIEAWRQVTALVVSESPVAVAKAQLSVATSGAAPLQGKRVLVIGETRFVGRFTVAQLVASGATVVLMPCIPENDASCPFPELSSITCDRQTAQFHQALETSGSWDAVVDFGAHAVSDVQPIVTVLGHRTGHYIFMSSDSVYEVISIDARGWYSRVLFARRLAIRIALRGLRQAY